MPGRPHRRIGGGRKMGIFFRECPVGLCQRDERDMQDYLFRITYLLYTFSKTIYFQYFSLLLSTLFLVLPSTTYFSTVGFAASTIHKIPNHYKTCTRNTGNRTLLGHLAV